MMQAGVRVKVTCTSTVVSSIRRDEPLPAGATSHGDLLDKADFRPTQSGRMKSYLTLGGLTLRARAPKWALSPIRARVEAPSGRVVVTKTGGDALGRWSPIGIRPTFEWCLVLPDDVALSLEPTEVSGTLVAFLPNGGDIEANVRRVAQSCTPADLDRYRGILANVLSARRLAEQSLQGDGGPTVPSGESGPTQRPSPPGPPQGPPAGTPPGGRQFPGPPGVPSPGSAGPLRPPPSSTPPPGPPPGLKPPRLS